MPTVAQVKIDTHINTHQTNWLDGGGAAGQPSHFSKHTLLSMPWYCP
jgi:hypothetical protein